MRSQSRSKLMWIVTVATLLWFAAPAGAIQLESWDNKIPDARRFKVLSEFGGQAVLDKETQLVWEQSPDTVARHWSNAGFTCLNKNLGGRKGWRLPSVVELMTLIDENAGAPPFLPAGHPFTNVQSAFYWSATSRAEEFPFQVWGVIFDGGGAVEASSKFDITYHFWCVRGGIIPDQY